MKKAGEEIKLLFVGNPNCGKTTLFNALTGAGLKAANWPGVTVEGAEGLVRYGDRVIKLLDLPGVYSLDSYTMEERVTRQCLEENPEAIIVNVVSAVSLERNLYLTLQLLELGRPMILAVNMMDAAEREGIKADTAALSRTLGEFGTVPALPLSARRKTGLDSILTEAVKLWKGMREEEAERKFPKSRGVEEKRRLSPRVPLFPAAPSERYGLIEKILKNCLTYDGDRRDWTDRADRILTHPLLGIPILLCMMAVIFFLTFTVGDFLKEYFERGLQWLFHGIFLFLRWAGVSDWLLSLVGQGVFAGVGGVLSFLPNLVILFFALAVLEDSGYMARIAYIMNETMGRAGLSGRAVLPLVLGFGCTVPAVMAARGLETADARRRTILVTPFLSCSARLPIYVLLAGVFFPEHAMMAVLVMYVLGCVTAVLAACAFHLGNRGREEELLIELPDYRLPSPHTVAVSVRERVEDYLTRAGTTIFLASLVLWFLMNAGPGGWSQNPGDSFAAILGRSLKPVLTPAGLGSWQIAVALLSGLSAKEVVVSSLSVLLGIRDIGSASGMAALHGALGALGFGPANACAMMVFCLFYPPCMAAMAAIRRELGSLSWTVFMVFFQLCTAWLMAAGAFRLGSFLFG